MRERPNKMWERETLWNEPNEVNMSGEEPEFIEIGGKDEYWIGITEPNDKKLTHRRQIRVKTYKQPQNRQHYDPMFDDPEVDEYTISKYDPLYLSFF